MATDRQTPCLYYLGHDICFKAGIRLPIADCQNCNDYKAKASKQHKKKSELKIKRKGYGKMWKERY